MLLRCTHCDRPYKQPTWYYGSHASWYSSCLRHKLTVSDNSLPVDNFLCSTCTARRVNPTITDKTRQHTYLHTLVRCTRKVESDAKPSERSAEERMAALEQTVWSLTNKVGRVEDTLSRIERLLLASLASNKSSCPNCPHCRNHQVDDS